MMLVLETAFFPAPLKAASSNDELMFIDKEAGLRRFSNSLRSSVVTFMHTELLDSNRLQ